MSYLFSFESEFNEDLLQFFVDEVDAELFEAIFLEDLKTVNVQDSQSQEALTFMVTLDGHSLVHSLKQGNKYYFSTEIPFRIYPF